MVGSLFALTLLMAQAVPEQCSVIIPHPGGSGVTYQPATGYSVANATPPLAMPQGFSDVQAIACARQTLAITDNDFRVVLDLGVPMMIGAEGLIGSLELAEGQFQFRLIRGTFSEAQAGTVQTALDLGQLLARARSE
jgi:hypothetical protein